MAHPGEAIKVTIDTAILEELKEIRATLDEHLVPKVCGVCKGKGGYTTDKVNIGTEDMPHWLPSIHCHCCVCDGTGKVKP